MLYAYANFKTMNKLMPGAIIKTEQTLAEKILLGINIGAPVLMACFLAIIILGFVKYGKRKKAAQQAETDIKEA